MPLLQAEISFSRAAILAHSHGKPNKHYAICNVLRDATRRFSPKNGPLSPIITYQA